MGTPKAIRKVLLASEQQLALTDTFGSVPAQQYFPVLQGTSEKILGPEPNYVVFVSFPSTLVASARNGIAEGKWSGRVFNYIGLSSPLLSGTQFCRHVPSSSELSVQPSWNNIIRLSNARVNKQRPWLVQISSGKLQHALCSPPVRSSPVTQG